MPAALKPVVESCRYLYDPLDRLVGSTPSMLATIQRFYLKDRVATEIQGLEHLSIFQYKNQLLAQQQRQSGAIQTSLLATDLQRSILHTLDTPRRSYTYTPYGHSPRPNSGNVLEFNGERCDSVTRHYPLGNGYRAFNPTLMQFNSPDTMSPFDMGGLNAYAYCVRNPLNFSDPSGHFIAPLFAALTTKAIAVLGAGVSLAGGFMAQALGMPRNLVNTAAVSAITSAVVAGVAFAPAAPLALQQITRPIAQAALVVGGSVAATAIGHAAVNIAPVVRAVAPHVRTIASTSWGIASGSIQQLGEAAIDLNLSRQLLRTPLAQIIIAWRRGYDLPLHQPSSR